jgi:O-antigen/teichoic acid export membrane protein
VQAISIKRSVLACCPGPLKAVLARIEASDIGYRLAKGTFWSLAGTVLSRGLSLLASIVVARTLGRAGYGALGIIYSTIGLFEIFACFGLGLTATKYVAEYRGSNPQKAGRIVGLGWVVSAVTGGLSAGVLFVFSPWLAVHTLAAPHLSGSLRIAALVIFISALNAAQSGFLSGCEAFKAIAVRNLIAGILHFPLMIAGVLLAGLHGAVWAIVASNAVRWLICHLAVRVEAHRFNIPLTLSGCLQELPLLWRFSLPAVLSSMMVGPVNWICSAMLVNQPDGYAQMGLVSVGTQWRNLVVFLPNVIMGPVLPILTSALGESDGSKSFKKTLNVTHSLMVLIAFPLCTGLMFSMDSLLKLYWRGTPRENAVLIVLLSVALIQCLGAVGGSAIQAKGRMWLAFVFNLGWAVIYVALVAGFVGQAGAMALACGEVVAYVALTVSGFAYIRADLPEGMLRRLVVGLGFLCFIVVACLALPSSWRLWLALPAVIGVGAVVMKYLVGGELRTVLSGVGILNVLRRRQTS